MRVITFVWVIRAIALRPKKAIALLIWCEAFRDFPPGHCGLGGCGYLFQLEYHRSLRQVLALPSGIPPRDTVLAAKFAECC